MPRPSVIAAVLVMAVLGVSLSGPLVRLSHADPIAIAAWRLIFSLAIIAVPVLARGSWRQWRTLDPAALLLASAAGIMLALHFWSWNTSIGLTTIAASVVLVNTQPLVVAAMSVMWLREPPNARQWMGIALAIVGGVVVAFPDLVASTGRTLDHALLGDLLAVVGAITAAIYYVIGRRLRASLDLWAYVALVYSACLVTLLAIAGVAHVRLAPYPPREFAIFAGLAVGPMLLGHTALNWALRYARAYQVNVVLLGEPVGATLLAALIPSIRERPGAATLLGGMLILGGILLAERRART